MSNLKGKSKVSWSTDNMVMHRKQAKDGDVTRVVLDIPIESSVAELDKWRAILTTPDVRSEWDPSVESSYLVEMFDWNTRIARTNYTLGWPANPRDTVTISKTYFDGVTLIDISTSLPRSPDEPAYLRPAPPYVRSHLHLFAWCVQLQYPKPSSNDDSPPSPNKIRITCFWQHDFRTLWSSTTPIVQQLPVMIQGLVRSIRKRGHRIPLLSAYGTGVAIEHMTFEIGREALAIDYVILNENEDEDANHSVKDLVQVNEAKAKKRLERTIECFLPDIVGWDVQLTTRASSEVVANLPWKTTANRTNVSPNFAYATLSIRHPPLPDNTTVLKVKLVIELSGSASELRINGLPHTITQGESRDPLSYTLSQQMLQDSSSVGDISFNSISTGHSGDTQVSTVAQRENLISSVSNRSPTAEKVILARVRRNYIYFSSLLQEPEAKWKRSSEAGGVTISQLDSIDPTLVVYRAEAVFVGVGLWDLFSAIVSPGARVYWDKVYEDAALLEDVNELTELWHWRSKPSWPVNARDVVLLKTVYKSPTTIHVFSFSTDDSQLFSSLPPVDPNVIRTQVDLQGWAIETLSPTTTLVTLLEQSDPRGWAGKSSIPQQMINTVAGVGEYAIKWGGPPINTRLANARCMDARYDHEKGNFRLEYEGCENRGSRASSVDTNPDPGTDESNLNEPSLSAKPSSISHIECEIRCDLDTWTQSLEVVVDPPPQTVSCLRRHKLSREGGGLWLTICHHMDLVDRDRILVIVRRGSTKDKGTVTLNGSKIKVDVEDLPENEIKTLMKMKRIKPPRIPLDQPPVLGLIKRRRQEWNDESDSDTSSNQTFAGVMRWAASAPRFPSPLTRIWTRAVEQTTATTTAAVNIASQSLGSKIVDEVPLPPSRPPMSYALSALTFLQKIDTRSISEDWTLLSNKGVPIYKKTFVDLSATVPVHRSSKVIEGISAEEIAKVVNDHSSRSVWDNRFDSSSTLQIFGKGSQTAFRVSRGGFPFRDRGFYIAHVTGRLLKSSDSLSTGQRTPNDTLHPHPMTIFCAFASFNPESIEASFDPTKYNPHNLPIGRVLIEGWILETLDPYTTESFAIPSTKCTYVTAVDYAGSIPIAYNSMLNASLPSIILSVEQFVKAYIGFPLIRLPAAALAISSESDEPITVSEQNSSCWVLENGDDLRSIIFQNSYVATKKFEAAILISARAIRDTLETPRPHAPLKLLPETPTSPSSNGPKRSLESSPVRPRTLSTPSRSLTLPGALRREGIRAIAASVNLETDIGPLDLLLGEITVDTKLYPNGYVITVKSSLRDAATYKNVVSLLSSLPSSSDLPILCSCYELPPTPLHSSGLNTDNSRRQLLRFTLPTAQYENNADDHLSLQNSAKPTWLLNLELYGAIIVISIVPTEDKQSKAAIVSFNGLALEVMKEKDSSRLLRKELDNERLGYLSKLSRTTIASGEDEVPKSLIEPIAVATALYKPDDAIPAIIADSPDTLSTEKPDLTRHASSGSLSNAANEDSHTPEQPDTIPQTGLLRLLNGYQNALFRRPTPNIDGSQKPGSTNSDNSTPSNVESKPSQIHITHTATKRLYPLSTVLIIGLISFLFGSLLRSLLTPADFIYMSKDLSEVDGERKGWREIKRIVELKQIIGGWDFLVGVVRRH
ncbi:hypothetical protein Clacol_005654 [Clathrus columnatus]|uniref:START domain-containing protein n=1 Tax=Clathrus columnatus TaxID=1419009 RepID=A0AAV5AG11_9AGAM|nr:hypothetical protein Clacol_005654 [Clathrus columnatus]